MAQKTTVLEERNGKAPREREIVSEIEAKNNGGRDTTLPPFSEGELAGLLHSGLGRTVRRGLRVGLRNAQVAADRVLTNLVNHQLFG